MEPSNDRLTLCTCIVVACVQGVMKLFHGQAEAVGSAEVSSEDMLFASLLQDTDDDDCCDC